MSKSETPRGYESIIAIRHYRDKFKGFRGGETNKHAVVEPQSVSSLLSKIDMQIHDIDAFYNLERVLRLKYPSANIGQYYDIEELAVEGVAAFTSDLGDSSKEKMTEGEERQSEEQLAEDEVMVAFTFLTGPLRRQEDTILSVARAYYPELSSKQLRRYIGHVKALKEHMIYESAFIGQPIEKVREIAIQLGVGIEIQEGAIPILKGGSQPFTEFWDQAGKASREIDEFKLQAEHELRREAEKESRGKEELEVLLLIALSGLIGNYLDAYRLNQTRYVQDRTDEARFVVSINQIPFWETAEPVRLHYRKHRPDPIGIGYELIELVSATDISTYEVRKTVLGFGDELLKRSGKEYFMGNASLAFPKVHKNRPRFPKIIYYNEYEDLRKSDERLLQLSYSHRSEVGLLIGANYPDSELIQMILDIEGKSPYVTVRRLKNELLLEGELGLIGVVDRKLFDKLLEISSRAESIAPSIRFSLP